MPVITLHERKWAYCLRGGSDEHEWAAIDPAPYEIVRFTRYVLGAPAVEEARTE